MKKYGNYQIFKLLVLLSAISLLAGCGGGGGGGGGGATKTVTFIMPNVYYGNDGNNYSIPTGKVVKFYTLSDPGAQSFSADHVLNGKTGSTKIQCSLPDSLIGKDRFIFAVIELEGEFNPQGKSQQEIGEAVAEGKILLGRALEDPPSQDPKSYTFTPGVEIGNFVFWCKGEGAPTEPTHKIKFIMPDTYIDQGSNEYSFPGEKEVKFYALTDTNEPLVADYVFTGTTGGNIECDLPSHLVNEEYFFFAVVVLEGDFDLEGKSQQDIGAAVAEGKILFGRALEDPPSQNPKSYTLTPGVEIGNFVFWGKGEGE